MEEKAQKIVSDYYNYKIDMETMHERLYKLFGSYEKAVKWLYEHDNCLHLLTWKY